MGWVTGYKSKADVLDSILPTDGSFEIVDRKPSAEGEWVIAKIDGGKLEIGIIRLSRRGNDWGTGGYWPETCGPCESGCPVQWFERVPLPSVPEHDAERVKWAADFRARISAEHQLKLIAAAKRRKLRPGQKIKLAQPMTFTDGAVLDTFEVVRRGKTGLAFKNPADPWGTRYRISGATLRECEIVN